MYKRQRHILEEAGYTLGDVVKTTVLLQDIGDFAAMNAVYAGFFTSGMAEQLEKLEEIKGKIKALEAEKGSVENIIKDALGEATEGEYGAYRVSWKNRETTRLDGKALKAEMPDVYAKYSKNSSSRMFLFRSDKN